jgi:hypothetical protein
VLEEQVRDLRDREDEDEVVEQLERGGALLPGAVAAQRCSLGHSGIVHVLRLVTWNVAGRVTRQPEQAAAATVVIFGQDTDQLLAAAAALRSPPASPLKAAPGEVLPAPVPGAQNGTLEC